MRKEEKVVLCFRMYSFTAAVSKILGCVTGQFIYPQCSGAMFLLNYFMAGFHLSLEAHEPSGMFLSQVSSGTNSSVLNFAPLWANLVYFIHFLLSADFPNILEPETVLEKEDKMNDRTEREEGEVAAMAKVEDMNICCLFKCFYIINSTFKVRLSQYCTVSVLVLIYFCVCVCV